MDHVNDLEIEQAKREKRLEYSREWRVKNSEKVAQYERARGPSTPRTKAFFERKRQAKIAARNRLNWRLVLSMKSPLNFKPSSP